MKITRLKRVIFSIHQFAVVKFVRVGFFAQPGFFGGFGQWLVTLAAVFAK